MEVDGEQYALVALSLVKERLVSTEQEVGLDPDSVSVVLRKEKPLALPRIRTHDRPARSVFTIPHTPSRLLSTLKLLTKDKLQKKK
jgi:hypothetical protein